MQSWFAHNISFENKNIYWEDLIQYKYFFYALQIMFLKYC